MFKITPLLIVVFSLITFSVNLTEGGFSRHVCHVELRGYDIKDVTSKVLNEVKIRSDVVNITFTDLHEIDAFVPEIIPIFYYDETGRQQSQLDTQHVTYYEKYTKDCHLIFRVRKSKLNDTLESVKGQLLCGNNSSFEITGIKDVKRNGAALSFTSDIKLFQTNLEELKSYKDIYPSMYDKLFSYEFLKSIRSHRHKRDNNDIIHTRYVEMAIVIDHGTYVKFNEDVNEAAVAIMDIINHVDTIYRKYNIRIVLSTIEVWNVKDLTYISSSAEQTLDAFILYATTAFADFDNVHLITTMEFDDNLAGLGFIGSMCSATHSAGVTTFKSYVELSVIAGTVAHELGHNFNMHHDDALSSCSCEESQGVCLMHSRQSFPIPKHFSTCSQDAMKEFLNKQKTGCLDNKPAMFLVSANTCGNNKVDPGEECDCGSPSFCLNPCCDPKTCKLTLGSECAHGTCCHECKVLPRNTICRESRDNECDAIDYCNGVNGTCVNIYAADGVSCDNDGICYQGECKSRNFQCKNMFGNDATEAGFACYENANVYGEMYGHCGVIDPVAGEYKKCEPGNVLCGSLHCENVSVTYPIIGFKSQHSRVRLKIDGEYKVCYGGSADLGKENLNPGYVYDYTPCGINKHCLNSTCIHMNITPSCQHDCRPNGVCSNLGSCQCKVGWSGENCTIAIEPLPRIPPKVVKYYEKSSAVRMHVIIGDFHHMSWYFVIGMLAILQINIFLKM